MVKKEFIAKPFEATTQQHAIFIHENDAVDLGVDVGDRVKLSLDDNDLIAVVETTTSLVEEGFIGTFSKVTDCLALEKGDKIGLNPTSTPDSVKYIRKKIGGGILSESEIHSIIEDIVEGELTDQEMTAFLVAEEMGGTSLEERMAMTKSMVDTGQVIDFEREPVMDVHSIGGIPGNDYAMITVPIAAAAGFTVPKTSSRAITSPAGTPDVMEVLCDVSFSLEEISEIVEEVGAVLAWGGAVNLAPADDILVKLERSLSIDPRGQMLASVLSKKMSVGSDEILIDIPTGSGAKVESHEEAKDLAHDFMDLGHKLGLDIETAITYGGQPLGYNVGPGLEAREVLRTLRGEGPKSLVEKGCSLAGILLEMAGEAKFGKGKDLALDILESGEALDKMRDIIECQGGDPEVELDDLPLGDCTGEFCAPRSGYVKKIDNSVITEMARKAGSPKDKGAGLKLFYKEGQKVEEGEPLVRVFSEYENKLGDAMMLAKNEPPVSIETMLLERYSGSR